MMISTNSLTSSLAQDGEETIRAVKWNPSRAARDISLFAHLNSLFAHLNSLFAYFKFPVRSP